MLLLRLLVNSGILLLLTVFLGQQTWRSILKKCRMRSRTGRMLSETLFLFLSLALLSLPLLAGVLLQASYQEEEVVMMFGRDRLEEDSQEFSIVLVTRINSQQSWRTSDHWTQVHRFTLMINGWRHLSIILLNHSCESYRRVVGV